MGYEGGMDVMHGPAAHGQERTTTCASWGASRIAGPASRRRPRWRSSSRRAGARHYRPHARYEIVRYGRTNHVDAIKILAVSKSESSARLCGTLRVCKRSLANAYRAQNVTVTGWLACTTVNARKSIISSVKVRVLSISGYELIRAKMHTKVVGRGYYSCSRRSGVRWFGADIEEIGESMLLQ